MKPNWQLRQIVITEVTYMNDQIRKAIRQRARRAVSKDDLVRAVFDTFRSQEIDLRKVSLDDMKSALIEAARAAREHNPQPA
jgi:uncharacterized protein YijF (DUF1287 family)